MSNPLLAYWSKLPLWAKAIIVSGAACALKEAYERATEKAVEGEVVLITGAGSGIGRLMALKFAKLGAQLVLWDVNEAGVNTTGVSWEGNCLYGPKTCVYVQQGKLWSRVA